MTPPRPAWPSWRLAIAGLSAVGAGLCLYLSWHWLTGAQIIGCGGGSPCDDALSSRWSSVGGLVPVSSLAAGVYLAMFTASLSIGPDADAPSQRLAWRALLLLAGGVAGGALWFIGLQHAVLGAFCPYCMAAHATGLALSGLILRRAPGPTRAPWILAGLMLAGGLAGAQVHFKPPSAVRSGEAQAGPRPLDARAVPLIGPAGAESVVTLLFDYNCPHCQEMHWMLEEAVRRYGGKLAFALCPAPLNTRCNRYVPRDMDEFKDSCELARLALAVWKADRAAFPAFDRWLFSYESGDRWRGRDIGAAEAKARDLIGANALAAASSDPWIEEHLQASIQIYGETFQAGAGGIPRLIYGRRWVTPQPGDADELAAILQSSLGLPSP